MKHAQRREARIFVTIMFLLGLVACAPMPNRPSAIPTPSITQPACQPSKTQPSNAKFPEVQVTMKSDGEIWVLLFFDQAQSKTDEKIVWRVTGTGSFNVQAQHEDGTIIQPI
jgi:hypothetical protein